MTDFLEHWARSSDENARLVAQEVLITQVTEAIWKTMEEAGVSKAELAQRLGTTRGFISQVLSGSRNMTLRTLSDICFALEQRATFSLGGQDDGEAWDVSEASVTRPVKRVRYEQTGNAISPDDDHWHQAA